MGDIWKQLTKSLGPQWLLFSFMPSFAFWFMAIAGWAVHEHRLKALMQNPGVFESIIFLVLVIITAWVISLLSKTTVMFFEGYLLPPRLRRKMLAQKIRRWEEMRAKWEKLFAELHKKKHEDEDYADKLNQFRLLDSMLVYNYPSRKENIMPTDLGNILKASEEYPRLRYGIDPIVLWEHLYVQLPSEIRSAIDTSFNEMVLMLRTSLLSAMLGVEWVVLAMLKGITDANPAKFGLALLFLAIFGFLMKDSYRISLVAALKFSKLIRTSFDLYRDKLAEALGIELPDDVENERRVWHRVTRFIYRGIPLKRGVK